MKDANLYVSAEKAAELRADQTPAVLGSDLETENTELRRQLADSQEARVKAVAGFADRLRQTRKADREAVKHTVVEILTALKGTRDDLDNRIARVLLDRAAVLGLDDDLTDQLDQIAGTSTPRKTLTPHLRPVTDPAEMANHLGAACAACAHTMTLKDDDHLTAVNRIAVDEGLWAAVNLLEAEALRRDLARGGNRLEALRSGTSACRCGGAFSGRRGSHGCTCPALTAQDEPTGSCPCGGTGDRHKGGAKCVLFDRPDPTDEDTARARIGEAFAARPATS